MAKKHFKIKKPIYSVIILITTISFMILRLIFYSKNDNFTTDNSSKPSFFIDNPMQILQKGIINDSHLDAIIKDELSNANISSHFTENMLPKNIHFIWIGSVIPDKYIANINTYASNNPDYSIFVWVATSSIKLDIS